MPLLRFSALIHVNVLAHAVDIEAELERNETNSPLTARQLQDAHRRARL